MTDRKNPRRPQRQTAKSKRAMQWIATQAVWVETPKEVKS